MGNESILIADDSVTVLSMVSARFGRSGYDVLSASDGEEALRLAREHRPRLAILDLEMPGIDGLRLTRELRADPELGGMRIVLLTAHTDDAQVAAGFAAGGGDQITEPLRPPQPPQRHQQRLGLPQTAAGGRASPGGVPSAAPGRAPPPRRPRPPPAPG